MNILLRIQMDKNFATALPKRLAEIRKLQGLTQVQVAEVLGTTQGTYALYENGSRGVSLKLLPRIAEALNTTVEELLEVETKKNKRGPSSHLERRMKAIGSLSSKKQKEILNVVDALIAKAS